MLNEDLLGVRFRWGASLPEGLDCFGLMVEVRRRCNVQTPDFGWVYQQWSQDEFDHNRIAQWAEDFSPSEVAPGAFTLGESTRGPGLITTDGISVFYFSPRLRVVAAPATELRGAAWRI